MGCAVDLGRLKQGFRYRSEELDENHEIEDLRNLGKDNRKRCVQDTELLEIEVSGDHRGLGRNHHGSHEDAEDQSPAPEFHSGEGIGGRDGHYKSEDDGNGYGPE